MEYLKLIRGDIGLLILFLIAGEKYRLGLLDKDGYNSIMDSLEAYVDEYMVKTSVSDGKVRNCYEEALQCHKE